MRQMAQGNRAPIHGFSLVGFLPRVSPFSTGVGPGALLPAWGPHLLPTARGPGVFLPAKGIAAMCSNINFSPLEVGKFSLREEPSRAAIMLPQSPLASGQCCAMKTKTRVVLTAPGLAGGTCRHQMRGQTLQELPALQTPSPRLRASPELAPQSRFPPLCPLRAWITRAGGCSPKPRTTRTLPASPSQLRRLMDLPPRSKYVCAMNQQPSSVANSARKRMTPAMWERRW